MLQNLSIRNFAIVDAVTLEFGPGFNVLTGETGAGKSLIVDALHFLLGDRIAPDALRSGEEKAVVEALFQLPSGSPAEGLLSEWGMRTPGGEILLRREYGRSSGKTRSSINGGMATAAMVAELGDRLVDLHGQHEHQAIFNVGRHRDLVDAFGGLSAYRETVSEAYRGLGNLLEERARLGGDSREAARRTDLLRFQVQEMEAAGLEELDEPGLLARYQALKHGERITRLLTEAQSALDGEGRGGATGAFGAVVSRLQEAARLDPALEKWVGSAQELQEGLNQFSFDLARRMESYAFDEGEFQELGDRIDALTTLKRKYGESLEEIRKYRDQCREELEGLLGRDGRLQDLDSIIAEGAERYRAAASVLSRKRTEAGKKLASQVRDALSDLGLPHARLGVRVSPQEEPGSPVSEKGMPMALSPAGWDRVEFLFTANPGEPERPLAKTASGGEASRVMLALKAALAGNDEVPTLVFDEIDTGVGARTAPAVAERLSQLAVSKQVLCITHLAPIAGLGENHFRVEKKVEKGRTSVQVKRLTEGDRIEELAKMLGGEPVSETSRTHARELYARMRPSR